jgi:DNA-binding MarR family transcriptional regulator
MTAAPTIVDELRDVSERCICLHTRMAARAVTRAYDAALAPLGLEATQFTLLAAIAANPSHSVTAMADRLALERTSLSRNLALLQRKGLIGAEQGKGRSVPYSVTPQGETLLAAAVPLWRSVQTGLETVIGESSWSDTKQKLRRLRHSAAPAAQRADRAAAG